MSRPLTFLIPLCALGLVGCGADPQPFALRFAAVVDGKKVGCTDELAGFGPKADQHVGLNDLRFYVSNVRFQNAAGDAVDVTLDENEFQYASSDGKVALVDLTGNTEGSCASSSVAFSEGTARTHEAITGKTQLADVASISFDVGVPQALMRATIAANTPEGAPSPLDELYWNWNSGYRHFLLNFSVRDAANTMGAGYVHVGSRDCAPEGDAKALADRAACTYVNTPSVSLAGFALAANTVGVDLRKIVDGLAFRAPIYDPTTYEVIGEGPGVECHSSPTQPDCTPIFGKFGLDMNTGAANAATDAAFVRM